MRFSDFISNDQNAIARGPRFSERFSYMRQNADLDARWQVARPLAVTLGTGWERWDRSATREVRVSDEFFAKAAVDVTPADWLMIRATYLPSFRRIGEYRTFALAAVNQDAAPGEPGQSYLLRKFDESDRDRQRVDLMMQITPTETLTITPSASYRFDNHIASGLSHDASGVGQNGAMLGLQQAVSWSAGMDVTGPRWSDSASPSGTCTSPTSRNSGLATAVVNARRSGSRLDLEQHRHHRHACTAAREGRRHSRVLDWGFRQLGLCARHD